MVSNASGEHGDTGDRNGEIARVLEDVLVRRSHGEEVDAKSVCASHPSLMPELEEQLAALEVVEAAAQRAASGDDEGKEQSGDQADSAHLEDAPGSDWDEHSSSDAYAASNSSAYPRMPGYRITGVLGHGGMGVVYRAVQTKLNRVVALKVLPAIVGIASPSAVARFRREAAAAARLHHTNIVPVHDFGESDDGYYYAMELVHGRPMDEVIRYFREKHILTPDAEQLEHALEATSKSDAYASDDGLSKVYRSELDLCAAQAAFSITAPKPDSYYRQVARWVADAADALHYAHGQRIIHRDVKPSNLLLSVDGRVMVADFGLAKNTDEKTMTRTGVMLGTVMYLSPEQAQSDKMRVDHRSDIYSLGATLFELICHRPVFLGNDEKQVLAAIINQEPVRPRRVVSAIPSELETICLKCLEKSPDARYETAEDMAADLRRFIGDLPIVAKRPSLFTRGVKYVRRHKAAVIALTAVLLLVAASFGIAYISRERELADINSLLQEGVRYSNDGKDAAANQKFAIARNSFAEAAKLFEEILQDHPNHFKALGNLAIAKKELFNAQSEPDTSLLEEADGYLLRALAVNPEHAGLLNIHGVVLKMLGRY
ncbi:MAG: serine/threonine-protein kinase, partial [Planctomycetota bacterium]